MGDNSFLRDFKARTLSSRRAMLVRSVGLLRADDLRILGQCWLKLVNSFLARMLSSRRAMSQSMILRVTSNGSESAAEHEVLSTGGNDNYISDLNLRLKNTYLEPCDILNEEARASTLSRHKTRYTCMTRVFDSLGTLDEWSSWPPCSSLLYFLSSLPLIAVLYLLWMPMNNLGSVGQA